MAQEIVCNLHKSISFRPYRHACYGMNDGQESVQGHQDECVDACMARHDDHILNLEATS